MRDAVDKVSKFVIASVQECQTEIVFNCILFSLYLLQVFETIFPTSFLISAHFSKTTECCYGFFCCQIIIKKSSFGMKRFFFVLKKCQILFNWANF